MGLDFTGIPDAKEGSISSGEYNPPGTPGSPFLGIEKYAGAPDLGLQEPIPGAIPSGAIQDKDALKFAIDAATGLVPGLKGAALAGGAELGRQAFEGESVDPLTALLKSGAQYGGGVASKLFSLGRPPAPATPNPLKEYAGKVADEIRDKITSSRVFSFPALAAELNSSNPKMPIKQALEKFELLSNDVSNEKRTQLAIELVSRLRAVHPPAAIAFIENHKWLQDELRKTATAAGGGGSAPWFYWRGLRVPVNFLSGIGKVRDVPYQPFQMGGTSAVDVSNMFRDQQTNPFLGP